MDTLTVLVFLALVATPAPADVSGPVAAALADAQSAEPARHERLREELGKASFLETLDTPSDYQRAARVRLHVDGIVMALARNAAPSARAAWLALLTDRSYLADEERVTGLILASVEVRPAPPTLVRFWDRHSHYDDGYAPTTIAALADNGSPGAIALLERKLASPMFPDDDKRAWMRGLMLVHRNDLLLLEACERLLAGGLKQALRPSLVEVLFDYRPEEWYRPASSYSPPPLDEASPAARTELRRLAKVALSTIAINARQRAAVKRRLRELGQLEPKKDTR